MKNIFPILILLLLLGSCKDVNKVSGELICDGIQAPEPEKMEAFEIFPTINEVIPTGYTIVQTKEGEELIYSDLNQSGRTDAVALIELRGDTSYEFAEEVLLVIFTGDRHGELQIAAASKNLGGESVSYSDTKKLSLKKGVVQYHHQSMRHQVDLKFRYENKYGEFKLIGKDYEDYGGIEEGPRRVSINYLTGLKLIDESKWDEKSEELVALPQKREKVSKALQSLSDITWDKMYDDL